MPLNSGYVFRVHVDRPAAGTALIDFLTTRYSHSSRLQWQKRIESGEIFIGERLATIACTLKAGDLVLWSRPGWHEEVVPKEVGWIYEDDEIVAVSKPSGLPTLPGGGFLENTLLHIVREVCPTANPLHRLGRATSGIVLFALNRHATSVLSQEWPEVEKTYLALATGSPRDDEFEICTRIGRSDPGDHPRLAGVYRAHAGGKEALSVVKVVERRENNALLQVKILTGRPHQIRIHLASMGHPLVGDPMYASGGGFLASPGLPGDPGYSLHAWKLRFRHPLGKRKTIELLAQPPAALLQS